MILDSNGNVISVYDAVLGRVLDRLAAEIKFHAESTVPGTASEHKLSMLCTALTYPPMTYFGMAIPAMDDIEDRPVEIQLWIFNLVNSMSIDWQMYINTLGGDISVAGFMNMLETSVSNVIASDLTQTGYAERIKPSRALDPVVVTLYLMSVAYLEIAKSVSVDMSKAKK